MLFTMQEVFGVFYLGGASVKWLVFVLMMLSVIGCEAADARLEMVPSEYNHTFYLETFEPSMITMRYIDGQRNSFEVPLSEAMVVGGIPSSIGEHILLVRHEDAEIEIWVNFLDLPLHTCPIDYVAHIVGGNGSLNYETRQTSTFRGEEDECVIEALHEPWDIDGYTFSHYSQSPGDSFSSNNIFEVFVYYEPLYYDVRFFNYDGTLLDIVPTPHNENLTGYHHDFPSYYEFHQWDVNLSTITQSMDVHPQGRLATYFVTFLNYDGRVLESRYVEHASDIPPPTTLPKREGYTHVGWNAPLENITQSKVIEAVYEKNIYVDDMLDDILRLDNYTASIEWENIPYNDGTVKNTFEVDGAHVRADAWGEVFYLMETSETLYIVAQYDPHIDPTWVRTVYLGESVAEFLIIDVFALEDSMLTVMEKEFTVDSTHYERLFATAHEDVERVSVASTETLIRIMVEWVDETYCEVVLYDVGQTSVSIPQYVEVGE